MYEVKKTTVLRRGKMIPSLSAATSLSPCRSSAHSGEEPSLLEYTTNNSNERMKTAALRRGKINQLLFIELVDRVSSPWSPQQHQ